MKGTAMNAFTDALRPRVLTSYEQFLHALDQPVKAPGPVVFRHVADAVAAANFVKFCFGRDVLVFRLWGQEVFRLTLNPHRALLKRVVSHHHTAAIPSQEVSMSMRLAA